MLYDIVHIIYGLAPGGAENLVRDMARVQSRAGHTVTVMTLASEPDMTSGNYAHHFAEDLQNCGVRWMSRPTRKASLGSFRQPFRRVTRPTLIHCHIYRGLVQALVRPRLNTRVIYTHHNSVFPVHPKLVFGLANRVADAFVSVCGSADLAASGCFTGPHGVLHNGIELRRYRTRPQGLVRRTVRLVNIGALDTQKNHLKALAMMAALGPGFHLTIFGEGRLRSALEHEVARLELLGQVTLAGVSSELPHQLAEYDLMLQTSDWEGMPLSLLEACAVGLPILATNVGDTRCIVRPGETGMLVQVSDSPQTLADAVRSMTVPETHARLVSGCLRAAEEFDVSVVAERYDAVARALFEGHPTRSMFQQRP